MLGAKWKARSRELEVRLGRAEEFITDLLSYRAGEKATGAEGSANPYQSRERLVAELVNK